MGVHRTHLVVRQHLAGELSSIVERRAHAIVDLDKN